MALVVFLRGVNVGGHRKFQPTKLVEQLRHLDAVNIGAAGTLVVRKPVAREQLRLEIARRLSFETEIVICQGRDVVGLMSHDLFADNSARPGVVRFVSVMSKRAKTAPPMPVVFPEEGRWLLRVLGLENRFILGEYRRDIKAIGHLGKLDRLFGVPVTTRNWNTMRAIAKVLNNPAE